MVAPGQASLDSYRNMRNDGLDNYTLVITAEHTPTGRAGELYNASTFALGYTAAEALYRARPMLTVSGMYNLAVTLSGVGTVTGLVDSQVTPHTVPSAPNIRV